MIEHSFNREQVSEMYDIYLDYINALDSSQVPKFIGRSRLSHINESLGLSYEGTPQEAKEQLLEHLSDCFPSSNFQYMLKFNPNHLDKIDKKSFYNFLLDCQKNGVDIVSPLEKEIAEKSTQDRSGINFLIDALVYVTSRLPEHKKASHVFQLAYNYKIDFSKQDTRNRLRQASHMVEYSEYKEAQKFFNNPQNPQFIQDYIKEKINTQSLNKSKIINSEIEDYYLVNFKFKHSPFTNDEKMDGKIHQYMTARLIQKLCIENKPLDKDFHAELAIGNRNPEIGSSISFVTKDKKIQEELKRTLQLFNDNIHNFVIEDVDIYTDFCQHFDKIFAVCKLQRDLPEKAKSPTRKI
jgi:hypothetical protein